MKAIVLKSLFLCALIHQDHAGPPKLLDFCPDNGPGFPYRYHHPNRWTPEVALAKREAALQEEKKKGADVLEEMDEFAIHKRCVLDYVEKEKRWRKEMEDVNRKAREKGEDESCARAKAFFELEGKVRSLEQCDVLLEMLSKHRDYHYRDMMKHTINGCKQYLKQQKLFETLRTIYEEL